MACENEQLNKLLRARCECSGHEGVNSSKIMSEVFFEFRSFVFFYYSATGRYATHLRLAYIPSTTRC